MTQRTTFTILLSLLFFVCASAQVKLGFPGEANAYVGIYVKDLTTGKVVAQNEAQKNIIPASVMKAITAASALTKLGKDFEYTTPVYLYGAKSATNPSLWEGNLVIESCADPTIDSEYFDELKPFSTEIIEALKDKGISEISGQIEIRESLKEPGCNPVWIIEDVAYDYGAGLFGFNFHDNCSRFWPATNVTKPEIPGLNVTKIKTDTSIDLIRGVNSNNLLVVGRNLSDKKTQKTTTMVSPAESFKCELSDKLAAQGITLGNNAVKDESLRVQLVSHNSPKLLPILRQMMVHSINLYAEAMLRALAPNSTLKAAIDNNKRIIGDMGVTTAYNCICDGSGLSRKNTLQPKFLSDVLEAMAKSANATDYVSLFPLAGKEGTVKSLLSDTPLSGTLALKSGSMNGVQCFAGYKLNAKGKPTHTVVILINSFYCERKTLRSAIEKFLVNTFK